MKKTLNIVILFLLPAALLLSQSLVEVSKKEQERREKLKGKNVKVITNADLKSVKRTPAVTTQAAPSGEAEPQEQDYAEARAAERAYDEGGGSPFATAVLPDTVMVENPELALYSSDGKYAEITLNGFLDVEIRVKNGPGDDIAIYARSPQIPDHIEEGVPTYPYADSMSYGVMANGDSGDWQAVGRGAGGTSPEKFDLGSLTSINKIRIFFKPHGNPTHFKLWTIGSDSQEITMGIDAVEALH